MEDDLLSTNEQITNGELTTGTSCDLGRETLDHFLSEWKFFMPTLNVTATIVQLNQEFLDNSDDRRDKIIKEREDYTIDDIALPDSNDYFFLNKISKEVSRLMFHGTSDDSRAMSYQEAVEYYSKLVSERIHDHLAMLARSPHAEQHGTFSISEELSSGIADQVGLDLYLSSRTPTDLRRRTADCLNELGYDFQNWLVTEKGGSHPTTWGMVCASEQAGRLIDECICGQLLVLEADVEKR